MSIKDKNQKQSFLEGALVLVVAIAVVKVLGAIYKIPIGNLLGERGMGFFNTAYGLYLPIYMVALSGMPVAVCRMVASSMANGNYHDARSILRVAKRTFLVIGVIGTSLVLIMAYPYLLIAGAEKGALLGIIIIAPAILFCCIMSTYRGYYEGMCNMTPTAVSQVIEAAVKVILGLGFVVILKFGFGVENAAVLAASAIAAIMLGSVFGALYLKFRYVKSGDGITPEMIAIPQPSKPMTGKRVLKQLLTIAIPIALGALASQITNLVDVFTIQRLLRNSAVNNPDFFRENYPKMWENLLVDPEINGDVSKLIDAIPTYFYGCYEGFAFSIYSLVPTITAMLGVSALPQMTTAFSKDDKKATKETMESVLRITALLCIPAGFGIAALSGGILHLLYFSKPVGADITTPVLTVLGFAVIFGGFTMPMTNLLQAVKKERIPVINMLIGVILKIGINCVFVSHPEINITGAGVSTLVCYAYIFFSNLFFLCKYSKVTPNFMTTFFKPLLAAALCGLGAWATNGLLSKVLSSSQVCTVVSIAIAGIIYIFALGLLKVLTKSDILMLPKGEKIAKVLEKFHFIG